MRRRFLDPPPQRDSLLRGIDVVPANQPMSRRVVELIVEDRPSPILDAVLDRSEEEDHDQRYRTQGWIWIAEYPVDLKVSANCWPAVV